MSQERQGLSDFEKLVEQNAAQLWEDRNPGRTWYTAADLDKKHYRKRAVDRLLGGYNPEAEGE